VPRQPEPISALVRFAKRLKDSGFLFSAVLGILRTAAAFWFKV
jgi:hypothetical protein